jgi:hypothetical protein
VEHKEIAMPKVVALHEIELRPGVSEEEFENFFATEIGSDPIYPGWWAQLLKANRGQRAGKYLVLFEIESIEVRDRYFPSAGERSEEARQFTQHHPEITAMFEKWSTLTSPPGEVYTDYIVLGGS